MDRKTKFNPPPIEPPAAIAIVCELLGVCWECGEPVKRTPAGMCALVHLPGCPLAGATREAAS